MKIQETINLKFYRNDWSWFYTMTGLFYTCITHIYMHDGYPSSTYRKNQLREIFNIKHVWDSLPSSSYKSQIFRCFSLCYRDWSFCVVVQLINSLQF